MSERERERLSIGREYELVFSVCTHTCGNKEVDIEGVCVCVCFRNITKASKLNTVHRLY